MSLRPEPLLPIPDVTAAAVRAAFPKGNLYVDLRTEFGTLYEDQLFADLYPPEGRPVEVAPWRLALVVVMQYIEGLTDRQTAEVCQTQPIKMTWCSLRLFRQTRRHLRGACKRENELDVYRFSRHNDFADQALGDGLPFFKRELGQILAQQLAKGLGIVHHLLPMDALLPRLRSLATFLGNLVQLCSKLLTPCLQLLEIENLGLIGLE
jgi:hypothetical protein